jgi:alkylhydroperoxidase/carboxymuconolactone decarboxylase family protein YurZ
MTVIERDERRPGMAKTPLDALGEISPDLAEGFRTLRAGVFTAGPLAHETVELIVVGALAATRQHRSLRVHLRRLMASGVDVAAVRQAIVATLGAAATLSETVEALEIVESVVAEAGS